MNHSELAAKFESGEIGFNEYMETALASEKFEIRRARRNGRRLAALQGAVVTPPLPPADEDTDLLVNVREDAHREAREGFNKRDHYYRSGEEIRAELEKADRTRAEAAKDYEARKAQAVKEPEPFVAAPGRLSSPQAVLAFIVAGNAYFTVRSAKTGTRYTFRVSLAKQNDTDRAYYGAQPPRHFVSLLTGPENTSDYSYLGMIQGGQFRLTRASRMTAESLPVKAFQWVLNHVAKGAMPPQTEIWHEGRCGRCGRMLTVPESLERGIGPECAGRMGL